MDQEGKPNEDCTLTRKKRKLMGSRNSNDSLEVSEEFVKYDLDCDNEFPYSCAFGGCFILPYLNIFEISPTTCLYKSIFSSSSNVAKLKSFEEVNKMLEIFFLIHLKLVAGKCLEDILLEDNTANGYLTLK